MSRPLTDTNGRCLNCDTALRGGDFCSQCGQKATTGRINFRETLNDFLESTFSLKAPLMRTIKLLILNPGKLFREYIDGRRKTYYRPVAFFLLFTAIYLIIKALIHFDPLHDEVVNDAQKKFIRIRN